MDQAERLRQLLDRASRRARVLAVSSGKGGVGKTTLAVNLSIALARSGKKVVLVDVDIGLANADVVLGVEPRVSLAQVLSGETGILDALLPCPGGIHLLAGSSATAFSDLSASEREFLLRGLRDIAAAADFIVIDTGAGISRNVLEFCRAADEVLVVTTPEPTAVTDAYALIKCLAHERGAGKIRLVVNQALDRMEAGAVAERMRAVARRFLALEVENLGYVLADDSVRDSVRARRPVLLAAPRSTAAVCVRALAERVLGSSIPRERAQKGFLHRFAEAIGVGGRRTEMEEAR